MKRTALLFLCLTLMLFAVKKLDIVDKSVIPTEKTRGARYEATSSVRAGKAEYRPAIRQPVILFVEDPGNTGFGPLIKPDPLWDTTLTHLVGAGNFGWFGATVVPEEDGPDLATMQAYDLVIWNCYDHWWTPPALTTNDMNNIQSYISGGGKVWLLGHDIIWSGVPLAWLQTNFHLQSVIEDYVYDIATLNLQGLAEIAGITVTVTSDYQANNFFSDDLTPDANAHHVILDVDYSAHPSIFSNDLSTSFWTVDGRLPNPVANWEQMVQNMLDAFGVFGPAAFWDFEDGWQGWIHTNGLAFPEAWDVLESGYQPSWTPPDAGDSTMWIDSDAAGTGVVVEDTAISPAVVTPDNMLWLRYGLGYRNLSSTSDSLSVGIITFSGGVWNPPVELKQYNDDFGPDWDSIDVSAHATADSVRVYFYYIGEYDWWAGFDNVGLYSAPGHDVGCTQVTSPPAGWIAAGDYDVIGRIQNLGGATETFDVTANVYDTLDAWNLIFTQTVTFTDFPIDGDSLHNFGLVTFDEGNVYYTEIFTLLAGDMNPANDTADAIATVSEWIEDFESTSGGFVADPVTGAWEWGVPTSGPGGAHSGTQLWATILAGEYANDANWKLTSQDQYVATMDNPLISFYHWYDIEDYFDGGNVKYSIDGTTWLLLYPVGGYDDEAFSGNSGIPAESCFTGHPAVWELEEIIIPVSTAESFYLRFHFGSDASVTYPGWYIDDLAGIGLSYVGISEEPGNGYVDVFGFAPRMSTVNRNHVPIAYSTTVPSHVSVKVYDAAGRLIRTLVNKHEPAGAKTVFWNGRDDIQRKVADGVYFLKLEAEGRVDTRKMIFVR